MSSRPSACADTARAECRFDGCRCSLECTQESQATARLPKVSGADAPDRPCIVSVQAAAHLGPALASPAKSRWDPAGARHSWAAPRDDQVGSCITSLPTRPNVLCGPSLVRCH